MSSKRTEAILAELLKIESNRRCADCGQKGTRWASWNIGVFLCIRCGGLHRKLGTHISRVKSVTLDSWTDEEINTIRSKGNEKINALYNPDPLRYPFPTFSGDMEQYIRDKYERKLFMNSSNRSNAQSPTTIFGGNATGSDFFSGDFVTAPSRGKSQDFEGFGHGASTNVFGTINPSALPQKNLTTSDKHANDWTDMELSRSSEDHLTDFKTKVPEAVQNAPQTRLEPEFFSSSSTGTHSIDKTSDQPLTANAVPWSTQVQTSTPSQPSKPSMLFPDDDDPFKELTHNPFV